MKSVGFARKVANDAAKADKINSKHYIQRNRPEKQFLREMEADTWLNNEGKQFYWGQQRSFVSGKFQTRDQPFPSNSYFKIDDPLGDKVKQELFNKFVSNPDKFSFSNLANGYRLSIDRVKAVIKLKWLEKGMETEGTMLQHHYQAVMDKLLEAKQVPSAITPETPFRFFKARDKPIFVPSDSANMTPAEAAKAMHTDPFRQKVEQISKAASKPMRIPKFLSDKYCPKIATQLIKNPEVKDSISSRFVNGKLISKKFVPNNFYPGTLQNEAANPIFTSQSPSRRKPHYSTVFVNIESSKSTPRERWNPIKQREHIVPSVESGNVIVRDSKGILRTPTALELRNREHWGKKLVQRKLYKEF